MYSVHVFDTVDGEQVRESEHEHFSEVARMAHYDEHYKNGSGRLAVYFDGNKPIGICYDGKDFDVDPDAHFPKFRTKYLKADHIYINYRGMFAGDCEATRSDCCDGFTRVVVATCYDRLTTWDEVLQNLATDIYTQTRAEQWELLKTNDDGIRAAVDKVSTEILKDHEPNEYVVQEEYLAIHDLDTEDNVYLVFAVSYCVV